MHAGPRNAFEIHAKEATDQGRRQEQGGEDGKTIELAVGLGRELGVDLVMEEPGALLDLLEFLIEMEMEVEGARRDRPERRDLRARPRAARGARSAAGDAAWRLPGARSRRACARR